MSEIMPPPFCTFHRVLHAIAYIECDDHAELCMVR